MTVSEGVIKYKLDFLKSAATTEDLRELNVWRSILFGLGLIGQDSSRYEGYGFGNLSKRSQLDEQLFYISGTQTGNLPQLNQQHYVCVEHSDIAQNHVIASGPIKPSSEALTHSMFYQLNASIECVIHVHSPQLWKFGLENDYPCSEETVAYGTPAMATEIARLYKSAGLQQNRTLVMAGHEDGMICYGDSVDQAGLALVAMWVNANGR